MIDREPQAPVYAKRISPRIIHQDYDKGALELQTLGLGCRGEEGSHGKIDAVLDAICSAGLLLTPFWLIYKFVTYALS